MTKTDHGFEAEVKVPWGKVRRHIHRDYRELKLSVRQATEYKFLVDGELFTLYE